MMKGKRIIAILLLIFTTMSIVAVEAPEKAEASWEDYYGTVSFWFLDSDYADGKYRFRVKVKFDKEKDSYGNLRNKEPLWLENVYLTNSSGKTVATWKTRLVLENGGTTTQNYAFDFSTMPSDTYTFHIRVSGSVMGCNYKKSVKHSAGQISYSSSKYNTDTNGNRTLRITFNVKQLKGYKAKYEVFDSSGKRVYSKNGSKAIYIDAGNWYYDWNFESNDGVKQKSGKYTFKMTVNGRSASKTLNVTIK